MATAWKVPGIRRVKGSLGIGPGCSVCKGMIQHSVPLKQQLPVPYPSILLKLPAD